MTEKEFGRKVEAAADKLGRGLTRRYNQSRLFRIAAGGLSAAAGIGMLAGAKHLVKGGP